MKSAYYTAVVTNTYKMAMDKYFSGAYEYDSRWFDELLSVSHREYATGYYFNDPRNDANTVSDNGYMREKAFLAVATGYDDEKGIAEFTQRNKMVLGDEIEILTPGKVGEALTAYALYDENMNPIEDTKHPYMKFYMKTDKEVRVGDIIRAK